MMDTRFSHALVSSLACAICVSLTSCATRIAEDRDKPYNVRIIARDRWPAGVPLRVELEYDGPRFVDTSIRVDATPRIRDSSTASVWITSRMILVQPDPTFAFNDRTREVGWPDDGTDHITFDVRVVNTDSSIFNTLWTSRVDVPIRVGGSVESAMTPTRSAELDAMLREQMRFEVFRQENNPTWWCAVTTMPKYSEMLANVTFAMRFEVLRGDELIATASSWWRFDGPAGQYVRGHWDAFRCAVLSGQFHRLPPDPDDSKPWTLRIVPDPFLALRDLSNERYWAGELRLPLRVTEVSSRTHPAITAHRDRVLYPRWVRNFHPRSRVDPSDPAAPPIARIAPAA